MYFYVNKWNIGFLCRVWKLFLIGKDMIKIVFSLFLFIYVFNWIVVVIYIWFNVKWIN